MQARSGIQLPARPELITTQSDLERVCQALSGRQVVALDTEADTMHSYPPALCLVQLATPDAIVVIDPLAALDLGCLYRVLAKCELVIHGADFDLRLLYTRFRFVPESVFETLIAARLLGHRKFGLADLVRHYFGVHLEKTLQKANWRRRPLTGRMVQYAADDVRYLLPLAARLKTELESKQRLHWHTEACARLISEICNPPKADDDQCWRIKGTAHLSPRALAVVRELWFWRENRALALGRPPTHIIRNDQLVRLAIEAANQQPYDWYLPSHLPPALINELRHAVERANAMDSRLWPTPPPRAQRLTPEQRQKLDRLINRRNSRAALLGIEPELIAPRSMLIKLAVDWNRHAPQLMSWQRELLQ